MQITELAPLVFDRSGFDDATLVELYTKLVRPRLIEEKMLILLRQNKVSKWFSGIGQEAISVGVTRALRPLRRSVANTSNSPTARPRGAS